MSEFMGLILGRYEAKVSILLIYEPQQVRDSLIDTQGPLHNIIHFVGYKCWIQKEMCRLYRKLSLSERVQMEF